MTDNYHFEKPTIAPHSLAQQLAAWKATMDKRDKAWQEQFADTVPTGADEVDERLAVLKDKWHRSNL